MVDRGPTPDPYWDRRYRNGFVQSALIVAAIALGVCAIGGGLFLLVSWASGLR